MKHGKHARKSNLRWKRSFVLLTALTVLMLGVVGATISYLVTSTTPVTNTFEYAKVTCQVTESFDGTTKKNVQIKNTGNIDAYIRAAVIVTWKDAAGNVYGQAPVENTDYEITYSSNGWIEKDGYYYCTSPVASTKETPVLITECKRLQKPETIPDGYDLSVEILADAIQSQPANAVQQAWGYTPGSSN